VLAEVLAESSSGTARPAAQLPTDFPRKLAAAAPGERRGLLLELIRTEVVKGLGLEAGKELPINVPLSALGVDSLLAVELRNALSRGLGLVRRLPATLLFDYPSISALTDYLLANAVASSAESAVRPASHAAASPRASSSQMMDEATIAALSDEEAEALLIKELG
jgi:acyl carrier protein